MSTRIELPSRLLEPPVELELYDDEHVLVKVKGAAGAHEPVLELVLEDAALRELSRRRVTLRFNEAHLFRAGPTVAP